MLQISIPMGDELFDEETNTFSNSEYFVLELEHSLASLSKWEEHYEKAFFAQKELSEEELLFYVKCMIRNEKFPAEVFSKLTSENAQQIADYMAAKHTATYFRDTIEKPSREIVTAELIYYWMFSLGIPESWEHQHLNKLFTLIRVFSVKNAPEKKVDPRAAAQRRHEENLRRRALYKTSG